MFGIHANAARCIPLFLVYLATLTHTYSLISRHEAGRRAAAAAAVAPAEGQWNGAGRQLNDSARAETLGPEPDLEVGSTGNTNGAERNIFKDAGRSLESPTAISSAAAVWEFLLSACTACEAPPSFVIVDVALENGSVDGQQLEKALQLILDGWRAHDLEEASKRRRQVEEQEEMESAGTERDSWQLALTHEQPGASGSQQQSVGVEQRDDRATPCLASMGPLQVRFESFIEHTPTSSKQATETSKAVRALFEVIPLPPTASNTPGESAVGWPVRCLRPAATAASALMRSKGANSGVNVMSAEAHSRQAKDWYAATACLDILAFIYIAIYYNQIVEAAGSLSGEYAVLCLAIHTIRLMIRIAPCGIT